MEITSRDNKVFKDLLKLTQKKYRRESGLCIIEGEKIVKEHLDSAVQVFVRAGKTFSVGGAGAKNLGKDPDCITLDPKLFDLVSGLENSSGVLAVVQIPKARNTSFPYLVLDGIQDAGNMGTILRTAAAFGFLTVFCIDCVDVWGGKVLRASSGMQFKLNIIDIGAGGFAVPRGSVLFAADLDGVAVEALESVPEQFGLVLGSEGQGIRAEIRRLADSVVTVGMEMGCESLNVAVAGGILMHGLRRKNVGAQ